MKKRVKMEYCILCKKVCGSHKCSICKNACHTTPPCCDPSKTVEEGFGADDVCTQCNSAKESYGKSGSSFLVFCFFAVNE